MTRRLAVTSACLALLAVAASLLAWRLTDLGRRPAIDLTDLPHAPELEGAAGRGPVALHLRSWHFVGRELHDQDIRGAAGLELTDGELAAYYEEHLDDVEKVQGQIEDCLRELAWRHYQVPVYVEGVTAENLALYRERADQLYKDGFAVAGVRGSRDRALRIGGEVGRELAAQFEEQITRHRAGCLELGAAMRLCAQLLIEVRPLDDADAIEAVAPRVEGGKLVLDEAAAEKRRDAMARHIAGATEPLVVVVLGGAHDLRPHLARHAPGRSYLRATVPAYREAAGR